MLVHCLLIGVEQIDEQRREACLVEHAAHLAITWAMARALESSRLNIHGEDAAWEADSSKRRTSSSLICEKSSYHVLTA